MAATHPECRLRHRSKARALLLAVLIAVTGPVAAVVSITTGPVAVQTFDAPSGLAATGTANTQVPVGWAFNKVGGSSTTTYAADNGGTNSGNVYSYGATGSNERAFGQLLSGSVTPTIGAQLRNDTGATLAQLVVRYTGEQWRLGTAMRVDRLDFQYSLDATSLTTGTWIDVDALDFTAPTTNGTLGALDGNAAANRQPIEGTITGLTLAPNATLWVRWSDFNANMADDGLAIDDISFGTGAPPVDVAPSVAATQPDDGDTGVAASTNLLISFSEPVTVTAPWFTIVCTSGPRTAMPSGGPVVFTLDPTTDFDFGDACTVTVLAAGVVDRDGTPTPMAADYPFGFTVADDTAPSVTGTSPTNGANNVGLAANLSVTFSEPVAASLASFRIACGAGDLPYALSDQAQTTWTLNPAESLPPLTACTLRVIAAEVTDLDGTPQNLPADVLVGFTTGQGVSDYYTSVDASSCQALRASLHALIDDHVVHPYTTAPPGFQPTTNTWTILEAADQDPNNPARILDVYRNRSYTKVTDRASQTCTSITACYNREHTWPSSLGFGSNTGNLGFPNAPHTDGHMLHLSAVDWNTDRGNKPFANCPSTGCGARGTDAQPAPFDGSGGTCDHTQGNCNWVQGPDGNTGSFEPWRKRKGDMARAVLYMDVRYEGGVAGPGSNTPGQSEPDLVLTDNRALIQITSGSPAYMGLRSDLLAWHAADPPTTGDVLRNDVVQSFQGNRNPFVDRPEWVAIAFADPCTGAPLEAIFDNGFEP
jgi:endonuclease I